MAPAMTAETGSTPSSLRQTSKLAAMCDGVFTWRTKVPDEMMLARDGQCTSIAGTKDLVQQKTASGLNVEFEYRASAQYS